MPTDEKNSSTSLDRTRWDNCMTKIVLASLSSGVRLTSGEYSFLGGGDSLPYLDPPPNLGGLRLGLLLRSLDLSRDLLLWRSFDLLRDLRRSLRSRSLRSRERDLDLLLSRLFLSLRSRLRLLDRLLILEKNIFNFKSTYTYFNVFEVLPISWLWSIFTTVFILLWKQGKH